MWGCAGFAGIAAPAPAPRYTPPPAETDLAAQVAQINADAMADAPVAPPPEKRGGIFARLPAAGLLHLRRRPRRKMPPWAMPASPLRP